jgi:RNA-directed DNA polymerase
MRRKGYPLTRYADDGVGTCESAAEARAAVTAALRILKNWACNCIGRRRGWCTSNRDSSFLGTKSSPGKQLRLPPGKIRSGARFGGAVRYPWEKSVRRCMDQVRVLTSRRVPLKTQELIEELNPVLRGWGHHYKRAYWRKS